MRGSALFLTAATLFTITPPVAAQRGLSPVYRLVAVGSNDHVYTTDANEVNALTRQRTHTYEGVAFRLFAAPQPGLQPVYRYVSSNGTHLLDTRRPARGDPYALAESILGYAGGASSGLVPLHVWVNPRAGLSFYTTHPRGEFAAQNGYTHRGALAYVAPGD